MEKSIFGFVFRYSTPQQIVLLIITVISFPVLYISLELPKLIINQAINGTDFPKSFLGIEFEQIPYLLVLCFVFLALVCINGGFKYVINVLKGRMGERMLRRLRYELYCRVLRFPLPQFKRMSQGEIIPMITQEVEPLGGFIGDAVVQPVFQGGLLATYVAFMIIQDWRLGLAAIALYPFQGWFIPKLQRKVNALAKQRVQQVRRLSDRVGESIAGVAEIHAEDNGNYRRAEFGHRLTTIYYIRYEIYQRKFFIKFLNNFLAQLTPFFFYSIGGYLIIKGDLSFGAMVAVLAAYKDTSAPWKELLLYYQLQADARIKYDQVVEQFDPPGLIDDALLTAEPPTVPRFDPAAELALMNVAFGEDDTTLPVESATFAVGLGEHAAIVGSGGSGKEEIGLLMARLVVPVSGRLTLAGEDMAALPEAVTGRRIGYVSQSSYLFSASIRENLLLGLKHRPIRARDYEGAAAALRRRDVTEAERSGNSRDDFAADWVDYEAAGVAGPEELDRRLIELLGSVGMANDIYEVGLRGTIDPAVRPQVAERILKARAALRERLADPAVAALIEPFQADRYNGNATVAENLLFGTPLGPTFDADRIAANHYVLWVLDTCGLTEDFVAMGRDLAALMVELFADIEPGHELMEQYSFVGADDLQDFQGIVSRANRGGLSGLPPEERSRLLSLPFRLINEQHRLGLIDEPMQARLLEARRTFAENLPDDLRGAVEFFDADAYNAAATLQDNILFGKIAHGQAQGQAKVGLLIRDILDGLEMSGDVMAVGLDFEVGIGGGRLSAAQRQKLAFARVLVKRPDLLIVNMGLSAVETGARGPLMDAVVREMSGRGLVWILEDAHLAARFDRVIVMRRGRAVEKGRFEELRKPGTALFELVGAV